MAVNVGDKVGVSDSTDVGDNTNKVFVTMLEGLGRGDNCLVDSADKELFSEQAEKINNKKAKRNKAKNLFMFID